MVSRVLKYAIRLIQVIFVLIALSLVGAGTGTCGVPNVGHVLCDETGSYSILTGAYTPSGIEGQYFVFIVSLLLFVATIVAMICVQLHISKDRLIVLIVAGSGIVLCLINGSVEAWYATGWMQSHFGPTINEQVFYTVYNQSWAAATAFYFASVILYGIDFFLTYRTGC